MIQWTACLIALFLLASPCSAAGDPMTPVDNEPATDQLNIISTLVEQIAKSEGDYSPRLIEPLVELGRLQISLGQTEDAEETLRRAQHIAHRNEGVHTPKQMELIEMLIEVALDKDEAITADTQQKFLYFIGTRHFQGIDALPAYIRLGEWYIETGQFMRARKLLGEAITLIEATQGEYDPLLVNPLQLLSKARRLQGICCSERPLIRAADLVEADAELSRDLRAEVYASLGDAYTAARKFSAASAAYHQADVPSAPPRLIAMSKALNQTKNDGRNVYRFNSDSFASQRQFRPLSFEERLAIADKEPQRVQVPLSQRDRGLKIKDSPESSAMIEPTEQMIGSPFRFSLTQLKNILPYSLRSETSLATLSIDMKFTVTERGSARQVEFTNANVPVKLKRLLKQTLASVKFRPGIVDGKPVKTENVELTQTFLRRHQSELK